ncbi:valine--tRNA ligase [Candidatus Gracilibacteria bacterium]|nr:valine--tRNA ligase [Candidatus Gracilibacteria bacterium]
MSEFPKKYEPKKFEDIIYSDWEKSGCFLPFEESKSGKTFYIPMPPPNVTSQLHIGHSAMLALQDIMTRYHRMKGDSTLLLPGTDHASISTQVKVEQKIASEGRDKSQMSREDFLKECWEWNTLYGGKIQNQFRKMGTSCDWSKEKFTMDDDMNNRVIDAFIELHKRGYIYQGEYMVNYDPILKTVVSDQEVIYKEEQGKLYHITYFVSGSDNEVVIATTRPETLLGDVAVAVNPKDKRYKKLLKSGKKLILPIVNKEIPLIADEYVDMEFGTGALKITPAHDANDFELAKRHNLPLNHIVLDKEGKMTSIAGIFAGQDFKTARSNIVELLKSKGNLLKIENHSAKVGYGERTGAKIETIISKQWFLKIDPLVKKVIGGYKAKDFEIIPKRFNKTFEDWIYNLRDWCISRQLQWGQRIPVWYTDSDDIIVAKNEEEAYIQARAKFGDATTLYQDEDVLDTWFSSALWPFSTLGYEIGAEKQSELFTKFYPAQVLETGYDIIFFWVIRMLLFGYEFTGQTPFKTIYLHGLVRDKEGRKMSKSLGNGIDPLDMIEKYGTDALRMTLVIGTTPGNDVKFDEENVKNNMFFINKLWNASRFVACNVEDSQVQNFLLTSALEELKKHKDSLLLHETWILSRLSKIVTLVTDGLENYNFSEVGQELYAFTKNEFCDYYIEEFKLSKESSEYGDMVILVVLYSLLQVWHPYIPYVTEQIHKVMGLEGKCMLSDWPSIDFSSEKDIEKSHDLFVEVVKEIRKIRAETGVPPSKTIKVQIFAKNKNAEILEEFIPLISGMVKSEHTEIISKKLSNQSLVYAVIRSGVEVYIDTANAVDIEGEKQRLHHEILDIRDYVSLLDRKLLNESFVRNAPRNLVQKEQEKKQQARKRLEKLEEKYNSL